MSDLQHSKPDTRRQIAATKGLCSEGMIANHLPNALCMGL